MTITATAPRAAAYRGRLRWWTELPLIAVVYALYSFARLLVRGDIEQAVEHGVDILHFEQILHLDPEPYVNRLFTAHAVLGVPADFAYASLHYLVTPAVLIWLWRRRPTHYRLARTWLMISTLIGLVGFTLLPTAPPRLIPTGHGFVDTMAQYGSYGWWGTDASAPRGMGHLTNEYAAMPSLHVGWSLWCGIMLFRYGRHWTVRALGVLYPTVTALVVMGTANHYLLDAVAGCAVMGVGYLLAPAGLRFADRVNTTALAALRRTPGKAAGEGAAVTAAASAASTVTAGTAAGAGAADPAVRVLAGHVPAPRPAGDEAAGRDHAEPDRRHDADSGGATAALVPDAAAGALPGEESAGNAEHVGDHSEDDRTAGVGGGEHAGNGRMS